jgi:catalase
VLNAAGAGKDAGVIDAGYRKGFIAAAKTRQWAREPKVRTLA